MKQITKILILTGVIFSFCFIKFNIVNAQDAYIGLPQDGTYIKHGTNGKPVPPSYDYTNGSVSKKFYYLGRTDGDANGEGNWVLSTDYNNQIPMSAMRLYYNFAVNMDDPNSGYNLAKKYDEEMLIWNADVASGKAAENKVNADKLASSLAAAQKVDLTGYCDPKGAPSDPRSLSPLVQCGNAKERCCDLNEAMILVNRAINWFVYIIGVVAGITFTIAGAKMLLHPDNAEELKSAREMFTKTVIGLLIVMCAWLAVNTVISAIVNKDTNALRFFNTSSK